MDTINVPELVERLGSDEDAVRKMAAFKLQSSIGDPSFADVFIYEGGLPKLRFLTLNATGNTLAYSLTAFSRLLDVDKGWESVDQDLVKRVVELVVTHPLVNILRGAMSILAAIVSHPNTASAKSPKSEQSDRPERHEQFGFRALRPALAAFPQFLEMLVSRLSSADHALCTNALQLINSLMRDAITNGAENEWPKFIKRIQDLGVIRAVYGLMQSSALADLAQPLLEFQNLTKVLLRKWRDVAVDFERPDHRRAARSVYQASKSEAELRTSDHSDDTGKSNKSAIRWKRLGFETDTPSTEFGEVGYLGMMDLADYVRRNEDTFQKLMLEQATQPVERRCPVARGSIAVTNILYEHFEVEKADLDDAKNYLALDSRTNIDAIFKPMLLQWSKLHTAGLQAYFRLWKTTGAEVDDFTRVTELTRTLIEAVIGNTNRTKDIETIEDEIHSFDYKKLRELQMEIIELSFEDAWGHHLQQVREELKREAYQFIKEQRVRCLMAGAWFTMNQANLRPESEDSLVTKRWRFARLSNNRRWLHYADFEQKAMDDPAIEELQDKIDLAQVSSVVSNVTASKQYEHNNSTDTLKQPSASQAQTRILINTFLPRPPGTNPHTHRKTGSSTSQRKEIPLLTLFPTNQILASEWLDGLLMLLDKYPITDLTTRLLRTVSDWGLKIRLLNVRTEEVDEPQDGQGEVPTRDGLDENYYYDIFGGA